MLKFIVNYKALTLSHIIYRSCNVFSLPRHVFGFWTYIMVAYSNILNNHINTGEDVFNMTLLYTYYITYVVLLTTSEFWTNILYLVYEYYYI